MFKVDDRVRVVATGPTLVSRYLNPSFIGKVGRIIAIIPYPNEVNGVKCPYRIENEGDTFRLAAQDLELIEEEAVGPHGGEPEYDPADGPPIRTFDSGATRDTDQGKLDYLKALSPIVIRRYVQYLDKHREQPDGSYRDFDNWKQGIPQEAYISGGGRHFVDTWLLTEGYATEDNHGPVELEDAICAQLFNLMGRLHEMLKEGFDYQAATDHETGDDRTALLEGGYRHESK